MADEQGQAVEAPVEAAPQGQPFWSTKGVDGSSVVFNTAEDLEKEWRNSYLRQSDYTRKTQEVSEMRKKYEQQQKELQEQLKRVQEKADEYGKFDKFVKERPDVYNRLKQDMSSPPDANVAFERAKSYADEQTEELRKQLEEFSKWKREQEIEKQKEVTYKELTSEIPDLDRDAIEAMIQDLSGGDWKKLIKTLHFARMGQQTPVEMERRAAEAAKKKSTASVPRPGSPPKTETKYKNLDEAANALTRRFAEA